MIEHHTINIKGYGNMRKQSQPCWKQWGFQTRCDPMGQAGTSREGLAHSDWPPSSARVRWPVWKGEGGWRDPWSNVVSHNLHPCLCPGQSPSSQTTLTHCPHPGLLDSGSSLLALDSCLHLTETGIWAPATSAELDSLSCPLWNSLIPLLPSWHMTIFIT